MVRVRRTKTRRQLKAGATASDAPQRPKRRYRRRVAQPKPPSDDDYEEEESSEQPEEESSDNDDTSSTIASESDSDDDSNDEDFAPKRHLARQRKKKMPRRQSTRKKSKKSSPDEAPSKRRKKRSDEEPKRKRAVAKEYPLGDFEFHILCERSAEELNARLEQARQARRLRKRKQKSGGAHDDERSLLLQDPVSAWIAKNDERRKFVQQSIHKAKKRLEVPEDALTEDVRGREWHVTEAAVALQFPRLPSAAVVADWFAPVMSHMRANCRQFL
ncbi:MAG: hypothetical protein MHM6MM_008638, partial [Cercozoa sp. M6MM]